MPVQSLDRDIGNMHKALATGWITGNSTKLHLYSTARRRDALVSAWMLLTSVSDVVCVNFYNWHDHGKPNMFDSVINRFDEEPSGSVGL